MATSASWQPAASRSPAHDDRAEGHRHRHAGQPCSGAAAELAESGLPGPVVPQRRVEGDGRRFREIAEDQPERVVVVEVQNNLITIKQVALLTLRQGCWRIRSFLGTASYMKRVYIAQVLYEEGEAGRRSATPCLHLQVLPREGSEGLLIQHLLPEVELVCTADDQRAVQLQASLVGLRRWGVSNPPSLQGHLLTYSRAAHFQHEDQVPFAILAWPTKGTVLLVLTLGACPGALFGTG
mmetsp:Transcript_35906/g.103194  ORF Transcript_35906/g.103194 Transcript_35906/m.103194 type:complete len:238 (+) Transcript_35906:710-1423(+)